jgi:hypothetical protein
MPFLGLRTGTSPKKGYLMRIPSLMAAAFLPTCRWGGWVAVGVGGGGEAAKQGKSLFTEKTRPFIRRLSASQTSEHFLPKKNKRCSILYVDAKKCKTY